MSTGTHRSQEGVYRTAARPRTPRARDHRHVGRPAATPGPSPHQQRAPSPPQAGSPRVVPSHDRVAQRRPLCARHARRHDPAPSTPHAPHTARPPRLRRGHRRRPGRRPRAHARPRPRATAPGRPRRPSSPARLGRPLDRARAAGARGPGVRRAGAALARRAPGPRPRRHHRLPGPRPARRHRDVRRGRGGPPGADRPARRRPAQLPRARRPAGLRGRARRYRRPGRRGRGRTDALRPRVVPALGGARRPGLPRPGPAAARRAGGAAVACAAAGPARRSRVSPGRPR
jgi:hypothetical protein